MAEQGYHVGYKYPHDFPKHWVEQQYLPDEMLGTKYFVPDENIDLSNTQEKTEVKETKKTTKKKK
jgi:putative ATPase